MRFSRIWSDEFQRALARVGTAVWLIAGVILLALTIHARWVSGTASTAVVTAALAAPQESARGVYEPATQLASGEEIVLVFIGASFCNAQKRAGFPTVVETAKVRIREHARAEGLGFRAIGVSLDWRTADGLAFLARFGEFDEVASGGNWTSDSATKYIWRDIPGDADVPQMLVLRRTVQTDRAIRIGEDRVVKRIRGVNDIEAWVASGAAL